MARIKKFTHGFVCQVYDTDEKTFISQEFVAGDPVEWEDEVGEPLPNEDVDTNAYNDYLPFEMVQPELPRNRSVTNLDTGSVVNFTVVELEMLIEAKLLQSHGSMWGYRAADENKLMNYLKGVRGSD